MRTKNIYCIKCNKYRKFKNPTISYKTLVLSILCNKCGSEEDKILKEQESIETLKILGLIKNV